MYDSERVGKEFFPEGSKTRRPCYVAQFTQKKFQRKTAKKTLAKYRMREGSVSKIKPIF